MSFQALVLVCSLPNVTWWKLITLSLSARSGVRVFVAERTLAHGSVWKNLGLFLGKVGTGSRITLIGDVRTATLQLQIVPALFARRNQVPVVCTPDTCRKTCSADPLSSVVARLHDMGVHRTRTGQNPCTLVLTANQSFVCREVTDRIIMAVVMVTGLYRRLPSVATHSALAGDQRPIWGGDRLQKEDGSGVAIDWVTGRSYSSARRRLNVQSGQRKGGKCAAAPA